MPLLRGGHGANLIPWAEVLNERRADGGGAHWQSAQGFPRASGQPGGGDPLPVAAQEENVELRSKLACQAEWSSRDEYIRGLQGEIEFQKQAVEQGQG